MDKVLKTLLLSAILLTSALAAVPVFTAHAQPPAVIYVSPTGNNTTGKGTASSPYLTISHAVGVAPAGAEIIVMPGTYHEMVNFSKPLDILSESSNPANTIINASGLTHGIEVLGAGASGTGIEGLTVENANAEGIFVQDASNVIIANNQVLDNAQNVALPCPFSGAPAGPCILEDKGVELIGTTGATVASNTVVGTVADGGIGLSDDGPLNPGNPCTLNLVIGTCTGSSGAKNPSMDNVVVGNTVVANTGGCGIVTSAYNPDEGIIGNVISRNDVVANAEGIVVATPIPGTSAINDTVIGNNVVNSFTEGIDIDFSSSPFAPGGVYEGVSVIGNVLSGNGPDGDFSNPQPTGIAVISPLASSMVKDTTVTDNIIRNEYYGIGVFNATGTVIQDNTMDPSVTEPLTGASVTPSEVSVLSGQVGSLQSSLNSVQSSLSQVQSSVSQLQSTSATASALNALQGTVSTLQSSLSQLQGTAATQSSLNSLSSSVNGLSSEVTTLSANVNSVSSKASNANSQAQTAMDLGYIAIAIAIVFGGIAIALGGRRPSSKPAQ